jgi:hypothetical protein
LKKFLERKKFLQSHATLPDDKTEAFAKGKHFVGIQRENFHSLGNPVSKIASWRSFCLIVYFLSNLNSFQNCLFYFYWSFVWQGKFIILTSLLSKAF